MHAHTTRRGPGAAPGCRAARSAAVPAAAALAASGTPQVVATTLDGPAPGQRTLTYYAFDINSGTADPGFLPAPGSNPKVFSQGR
jgi:hypothetical protein